MTRAIRVFIVERDGLLRELIRNHLAADPRFDVTGVAADADSAIASARDRPPDQILLGVVPLTAGLHALHVLQAELPSTKTVVYAASGLFDSIALGMEAVLDKRDVRLENLPDELLAMTARAHIADARAE